MSDLLKSGLATVAVLLIALSFPVRSGAQEAALDHFIDGVEAFDFGNYENAEGSFKKAIDLAPENLEYQYYLGLTYSAMDRDEDALQIFKSIAEKSPSEGLNAYFEMAAIYTKQRRYQDALDTLDLAEKAAPDQPRVFLEKGIAYKNLGDYENAVANLNRAKALDPSLEQVVDYNIAGVYFEGGEFDRAEEMFQKVIEMDPDSIVAENARQSIANLDKARRARKPWYVWSTFAWGYDTNVALDARDGVSIRLEGQPDDKEDQFQIFQLNGGYKIINRQDLELGIGYQLRTTGYKKWIDYNLFGHRPYAFLRVVHNPVIFRFMYEPSWWYEGGDEHHQDDGFYLTFGDNSEKFLQMHSFRPSITFLEPYDMQTSVTVDYQIRNYSDALVYGLDSDSDLYSGSIIQSFRIPNTQCYPSVGYKYLRENADDSRESYRYHSGHAGVSARLFWEIWGDAALSYTQIQFNSNPDYREDGRRRDKQLQFVGTLRRAFTDYFYLSLYYSYTDNDSNVSSDGTDPFEFDKSVYAGLLTFVY